jgi:hypothetical protein
MYWVPVLDVVRQQDYDLGMSKLTPEDRIGGHLPES